MLVREYANQSPVLKDRVNYILNTMSRTRYSVPIKSLITTCETSIMEPSTVKTVLDVMQVETTTDGQNSTIMIGDVSSYPYNQSDKETSNHDA